MTTNDKKLIIFKETLEKADEMKKDARQKVPRQAKR